MSSLKMTFSLTSLILLIAFGLVFVVTPATAHKPDSVDTNNYTFAANHDGNNNTSQTSPPAADPAETNHTHTAAPTVKSVTLEDIKVGTTSSVKGSAVRLVDDVQATGAPAFAAAGASGEFQIKIVFNQDVYNDAANDDLTTPQTAIDRDDLGSGDFSIVATEQGGNGGAVSGITVSTATNEVSRANTGTTAAPVYSSPTTFVATMQVDTTARASLPVDVWITVNADSLYGVDPYVSGGQNLRARGNVASTQVKFTIVDTFETVAPTVTMTPATLALDSDNKADLTITSNEKLLGSLAVGDFSLSNATVVLGDAVATTPATATSVETYKLTVTVTDKNMDASVALKQESVMDGAGNKAPAAAIESKYTAPVAGTVTGTPSLTVDFQVTFTFDKAVSALSESDFTLVGCTLVPDSLYAVPTAITADVNKVWKATFKPKPNPTEAKVSVALNSNTGVRPKTAATGKVETLRPTGGTIVSITAPDDANDQSTFVVSLTFAAKPVRNPVPDDLKVTPADNAATTAVEGAKIGDSVVEKLGSGGKVWQVEITPLKGMDTKIELSEPGIAAYGSVAAYTVKKSSTPPTTIPSVDATYSATKNETTLTGMLAGNGFAVIIAPDIPDIQRFFAEGGSISVLSAKTGALAKDVVISEIMWGLNLRAIGDERIAHQFIELYNTTGDTIALKDVKLTFDDADTPPAAPTGMVLLDQVSNVEGVGWLIDNAPGQSGRIATLHDTTTFEPKDLISMYRKINYDAVEKSDHDTKDAKKNREKQLEGLPEKGDGNTLKSWAESNAADTYAVNRVGSPGKQHFVAYTVLTPTNVKRDMFVINEIGNYDNDAYDWVEIKRVGTADNLKKWRLSEVSGTADDKKDTALVSFPDNDHHKITAKDDVLLIVNSDPYQNPNHPLAAGTNITHGNGRVETTGVKSRYYVDSGLKLKNSGKTLLILRNSVDNNHLGTATSIQDVVGTLGIPDNTKTFRTNMWPLVAKNAPHGDVITDDPPEELKSGSVYVRNDAAANSAQNPDGGNWEHDLSTVGYTGVGYKRSAANSNQHGGTPGYPNNARVDVSDLADGAMVSISEIMYAKYRNEPQWIELHNSSMTQAVNLNEWKLKIEHDRDVEDIDIRTSVTTNNFGGNITIQPNQTVLIVSNTTGRTSRASQGDLDFPASRIINLWAQKDKLEVDSGVTRLTYKFLSQKAFKVTLLDKGGSAVDIAGNLGATDAWDLPASDPENNGEGRSSIIRRYVGGEPSDGTMEDSWTFARDSHLTWVRFNETYYGSPDDIGTPGFKAGGPLPVSLSKFRPERLKDTGEIVVRWITESELNNAGFNILRSEKRDSGFTKVHYQAGQGTTSERTVYEWKDKTAKPNVVYYYQIQDVSLDGEVTPLRITHLRGNVTAAGKLTTTWAGLKALQ